MSTYVDEYTGAALSLDQRRMEHQLRFKRYAVQHAPATIEVMVSYIEGIGATDMVDAPDLIHLPVAPVAGGIAFAPRRMTKDMLVECYDRCRGLRRPAEGRVVDRISAILDAFPTGIRITEIVAATGAAKTSVRRALEMMELNQEINVRLEDTRKGGTPRKRYFPIGMDSVSIDTFLAAEVL